ncbi:MAG: glycosyltransferase family 4 protein [archaeon]|jgi:glycosyltransferase involved in cell wall biosynthesis
MKIATNVTREYLGGITKSNISFLDFTNGKSDSILGIEINARRHMQGASIFNHLPPDWFSHQIINTPDINLGDLIRSSKNLKDLEKKYRPIIKIIKTILSKDRPDIVFLNGTYYIPWLISIAAHELKIPIVLRYAGVYTKETENFKPKARKFFNEIEKSFQKRVRYFIFPSRLCKDVVEKEVIKKEVTNSYIIPNPFDVPQDKKTFESVERRIAAIGRWDKIKNFEKYFKIHKELLKENWGHDASFVTGYGKIKSFPKTINRIAPMNHKELMEFYSSQGLIICPSLFETFGNVPIEAVCMGIPVLISENMGCAEVLKTAGLGNMVMSFDNIKEVTKRVKELCGQQILPKQINNLRRVLDPKVINAEIMSILRSTIDEE